MRRSPLLLALALLSATVAGCVSDEADDEEEEGRDPLAPFLDAVGRAVTPFAIGDRLGQVVASAGGLAEASANGTAFAIQLPPDVWVLEDGRLVPPQTGPWDVPVGTVFRFLVPPFAKDVKIAIHTADHATSTELTLATPYAEGQALVDGKHIMDLFEIQRVRFPHRTPGHPNYKLSQEYFEEYFKALGYEVTRDPYGFTDVPQLPTGQLPQGRNIQAGSMANVWAYRPGTGTPDRIVAFGGHYDMVEQTRDAAFDNTAGTLATMALARAFANVSTDVGLLFGLWGGEEDGLLGSQFFVRSNPDLVAQTILYVNLDVVSMAWPGPSIHPDPIVVSAGPDGPAADDLLARGRALYAAYLPEMPGDLLLTEPVVDGQARGAGVNAQSDHTAFIGAGVPSYFIFDGNVSNVFRFLHTERDTVYNMTWFMATNEPFPEDAEGNPPLDPEGFALGRQLLLRSFESQLVLPFYLTLEIDAGLYRPPVKG